MADQHIDIERMIMQAHYKMQLEAEASSVKGDQLSDMEREQYQNQIKDLLQAVETLLKSNNAMGEELRKTSAAYEDLKAKYEKLEGELAMRKRGQYRKGGEKPKDDSCSDKETRRTMMRMIISRTGARTMSLRKMRNRKKIPLQ